MNGACGKQSDIDGQTEGRVSGSERVNLFRDGASLLANTFGVGFIDWLDNGRPALEHSYTIFPIENFTGALSLIQRSNMN